MPHTLLDSSFVYWCDLFGIVVFAIAGALQAGQKRMDIFGVVVVALATAIGGGTLRDCILGRTPVFWVQKPEYPITAVIAAIVIFALVRYVRVPRRVLLVCDAFGLSVVTLIGCSKALQVSPSIFIAVMMGVITGVVGGVIRDVLCKEIPLVFSSEFYATASIIGGLAFVLTVRMSLNPDIAILFGMLLTFAVRIVGIFTKVGLPLYKTREEMKSIDIDDG